VQPRPSIPETTAKTLNNVEMHIIARNAWICAAKNKQEVIVTTDKIGGIFVAITVEEVRKLCNGTSSHVFESQAKL